MGGSLKAALLDANQEPTTECSRLGEVRPDPLSNCNPIAPSEYSCEMTRGRSPVGDAPPMEILVSPRSTRSPRPLHRDLGQFYHIMGKRIALGLGRPNAPFSL